MAGQFIGKTWPIWSEFESEFAEYCRESHLVYATLDSRTVERQIPIVHDVAVKLRVGPTGAGARRAVAVEQDSESSTKFRHKQFVAKPLPGRSRKCISHIHGGPEK